MPLNWKKLNRHELNVNIIHFHPVSFEQLLHMWVLCRVITELSEPQARPLRLTWPRWPAAVTVHSWQLSGSTSEASSFLEAAMCHQGPTASHFKSANLLFFKLVTLTLLSSYTTSNENFSGHKRRNILFIKLEIMGKGWVLHTPGLASCTG